MRVLLTPLAYVIILFGAYALKRVGFFKADDHRVVSALVLNVTLPAAVIRVFSGVGRDTSLYWVVLLGLLCTALPLLVCSFAMRRAEKSRRVFSMLNICGYNIGCFALPLVQNFFGAPGAVIACMFDTGNAMIMTGGSYAITSTLLHTNPEEPATLRSAVKKCFTSVPLLTYLLMLILNALRIPIPGAVVAIVDPIASANSFLAMLMVGLLFQVETKPEYIRDALVLVLARLAFAVCFALLIYYALPFPLFTRQVLAVLCFSPIGSLAPVYTEKCRGNSALASFANSISVVVGLAVMMGLSACML